MFTLYFLQKVKCYPYVYPIIDYNTELQCKWIQLKPVLNLKGDLNHDRIFENLQYAAHGIESSRCCQNPALYESNGIQALP